MSSEAIVERERRWLRPVALAAIAAVALVIASLALVSGKLSADSDAARLVQIHEHSGRLILAGALRGLGFALLALPLILLFQADRARSERVKAGLLWLLVLAPLFLAASTVVNVLAFDHIASRFVELRGHSANPEKLAEDLTRDYGPLGLAAGLGLAGTIGVAVGAFYSSLWGLRTGLMTRFLGTFGMAVAVVFLLIPFGLLIWTLAFGLLLLGLLPGGLPPAWAAGVAIPWPKFGEEPEADSGSDPKSLS